VSDPFEKHPLNAAGFREPPNTSSGAPARIFLAIVLVSVVGIAVVLGVGAIR
jgi:hypothetical protein